MYAGGDSASILIVDDSPDIISLLEQIFGESGFETRVASDGESALLAAMERVPDAIVLDIGLPGHDGLDVTRELRRRRIFAPVLMLTARGDVEDRVIGLRAGADDYLAKPFDAEELVARIQALLRRSTLRQRTVPLRIGDIVLDPVTREVERAGRRVALSQREFALLEFMMRHPGRVVSREAIAAHVWNHAPLDAELTNVVRVYVRYVRQKLEAGGEAQVLHTSRGVGYYFRFDALSASDDDLGGKRIQELESHTR